MQSTPRKLASVQSAAVAAPEVALRGAHRTPDGVFDSIMRLLNSSGVRLAKNTECEPVSVAPRSALKVAARHVNASDWMDGMTLQPVKSRLGIWRATLPGVDVVFVGVDAHALRTDQEQVQRMARKLARRLGRDTVRIVANEPGGFTLADANAQLCSAPASLDLVVASHENIEVLAAAAMALSGATACAARLVVDGDDALFEDMSYCAEQSIGLLAAAQLMLTLLGAHDSAERMADATDRVLNAGACTSSAPTVLPYARELSASELINTVVGKITADQAPATRSRPRLELV